MHRLATADRVLLLVIMHQNREDRLLLAGPPHTVFISRELARNRSLKNINFDCLLRPETCRQSIVYKNGHRVTTAGFTTPRSCRSDILCCMIGVLHPLLDVEV